MIKFEAGTREVFSFNPQANPIIGGWIYDTCAAATKWRQNTIRWRRIESITCEKVKITALDGILY